MNQIISLKRNGLVDEILPHLYLGDIETSQDKIVLEKLNIKYIINISNCESYIKWEEIEYFDINIEDSKNVDISLYFDKCREIINNVRNKGENVLVHCYCGVSRSVAIILSYLINMNMNLKDAFTHVKNIRTRQYTLPNLGFFKHLQNYEKKILNINNPTISVHEYLKIRN